MTTTASAAHCVGCGTPSALGGFRGFLCNACGDPNGMRYVCGRCTHREEIEPSPELIATLHQAFPDLGNRTTGITIVGSTCARCRREGEPAGTSSAYIVTRAS
ncbi:MAG: hypothetical protein Q7T01_01900 [bacterium]|nr:hypothetical protein [bacterium]